MGANGGQLELESLFFADTAGNTVDIYEDDLSRMTIRMTITPMATTKDPKQKVVENSSLQLSVLNDLAFEQSFEGPRVTDLRLGSSENLTINGETTIQLVLVLKMRLDLDRRIATAARTLN